MFGSGAPTYYEGQAGLVTFVVSPNDPRAALGWNRVGKPGR